MLDALELLVVLELVVLELVVFELVTLEVAELVVFELVVSVSEPVSVSVSLETVSAVSIAEDTVDEVVDTVGVFSPHPAREEVSRIAVKIIAKVFFCIVDFPPLVYFMW